MFLFMLSIIPVIVFLRYRQRVNTTMQRVLALACIPFAIMLAAYSLIFILALIALWVLKLVLFGSNSSRFIQTTRIY